MKRFSTFILLWFLCTIHLEAFDQVVIWGHKLHSSTHSYVHEGFFHGFKYLGYQTFWFDNSDDLSDFDFSNTLFLTEGQVDQKIPLRRDCLYFLHNADQTKYKSLSIQPIVFQVYTDDVLARNCLQIDTCIYYDIPGRCLYMPWATDLLPDEIEEIQQHLSDIKKENDVHWVGTIGTGLFGNDTQINPFIAACNENGIRFVKRNPWGTGVSKGEHMKLISKSYMAPAIVGEWQKKVGYIPCRIFKNISYGQMGVTNSKRVYEIMEEKIVYHPDPYQLFYEAQKRLEKITPAEIYELMEIVKTKHTYPNRIRTMLNFLEILDPSSAILGPAN